MRCQGSGEETIEPPLPLLQQHERLKYLLRSLEAGHAVWQVCKMGELRTALVTFYDTGSTFPLNCFLNDGVP